MKKDKRFNLKITERDDEMVTELRENYDINMSSILRECIRKTYKDIIKRGND